MVLMTCCAPTRCIIGEIEADWNAAVIPMAAEAVLVTVPTVLITVLTVLCVQFIVPES
jgi:hypothetical protein